MVAICALREVNANNKAMPVRTSTIIVDIFQVFITLVFVFDKTRMRSQKRFHKARRCFTEKTFYSVRKEFTGFPAAALNDRKLMDKKAIRKVTEPVNRNTHQAMSVW